MQFTVRSAERLPIRGSLDIPRGARALVILVGQPSFFDWIDEVLCAEGYAVCRSDAQRVADVRAVVRYCQTRIAAPVFLFGYAHGGDIAVLAAESIPNLRGVISWSANSNSDVVDAASRLNVPLLVIHDAASPISEAARDASQVIIRNAREAFNATEPILHVPRELMLAADVTARFISAYA
jgi:dienelactone hydrolase